MKDIKTTKQALLSNTHLENQLGVKLNGPSVHNFKYEEAIKVWYTTPASRSKSGKQRKKGVLYIYKNKRQEIPGPKPKKQFKGILIISKQMHFFDY